MFEGQNPKSKVHNPKSDVGLWSLSGKQKSEVWSPNFVRSSKTVWSRPTTYVCSKPGVQKQKSEVQNLSLKPKSGVSKKSKTEVQTSKIRSLLSEVCLKFSQSLPEVVYMWSSKSKIRSLSEVWNQKSIWSPSIQSLKSVRSPKYYVQSLTSEDRILKSKIATKIQNGWKKRIGLSKKNNQFVIIKNE